MLAVLNTEYSKQDCGQQIIAAIFYTNIAYGLDNKKIWKYDITVAIKARLFQIDIVTVDFQEGEEKASTHFIILTIIKSTLTQIWLD